jgi:hypothetical protein
VRTPLLSRPPANPRPFKEMLADIKKRHALTLSCLADHPADIRRIQAHQQSDAERDTRGLPVEINL